MKQSQSTAPPPSRPLSQAQSSRRKTMHKWKKMIALTSPQKTRVIALAIVRALLAHAPHKMKCWRQTKTQGVSYPHRMWTPLVAAPLRTPRSPQSSEDRGLRLVPGELSPRSYENHLLQHPGNHSAAFLKMSNHRLHWQTSPVGMLTGRKLLFAGTLRHHLTTLDRRKSAHRPRQKLTLSVIKSMQSEEARPPAGIRAESHAGPIRLSKCGSNGQRS